MSVHVVSGEKERALLAQKEKICEKHHALCDIPEEKALYDTELARSGFGEEEFKRTPASLRWMLTRLQFRIQEAKREVDLAFESAAGGVANLSGKSLCDVTAGELFPNVRTIWKVDLSGNFLKHLPAFCLLKPMIQRIDGSANPQDIEALFHAFKQENRVSFDLFHFLKATLDAQEEPLPQLVSMMREIYENPSKLSIAELASRAHHAYFHAVMPNIRLKVEPVNLGGITFGGLSTFIEMNPFQHLEVLDLSHCRLEHRAPISWLEGLLRLKVLNLSFSTLKEVPVKVKDLDNLELLDLSSTGIEKLPDWIGDLASLKRLNLSGTQVKTLPESFLRLELDELNLDGCPITCLQNVSRKIKRLSLVGAMVNFVPAHLELLWKKNAIIISDANQASLLVQRDIFAQYHNPKLASVFIYHYEKRRGSNAFLPASVQVHVTASRVLLLISFLAIIHLLYCLAIPVKVACLTRRDVDELSRRYPRLITDGTPVQKYRGSVLAHMSMMGSYFKDLWRMGRHIRLLFQNL